VVDAQENEALSTAEPVLSLAAV